MMRFNTNPEIVRKAQDDLRRLGSWRAVRREYDAQIEAHGSLTLTKPTTKERPQTA